MLGDPRQGWWGYAVAGDCGAVSRGSRSAACYRCCQMRRPEAMRDSRTTVAIPIKSEDSALSGVLRPGCAGEFNLCRRGELQPIELHC